MKLSQEHETREDLNLMHLFSSNISYVNNSRLIVSITLYPSEYKHASACGTAICATRNKFAHNKDNNDNHKNQKSKIKKIIS